ncbi:hypothetical protein [Deinococcus sp. SL84]|uniref:hypothetical protein n=1 Tax=Deinococcus sp. SL84 TaxID=2994663 RepID=UPI0022724FC0|nr:hypothetical protein [Deinococcus sp. SL84]MCY1703749.1 hypothetical protein [Deinococcus sp. SL84]MCY1703785.1 hypothetical protein [Deinococcus sp. SL84]
MSEFIIQKKRIRALKNYLGWASEGQALTIGLPVLAEHTKKLKAIGFQHLVPGETVLPKIVGPITRFNANGKEEVLRHLDKEERHHDIEWTRTEYHGRNTVEVTDWITRVYWRYPRKYIPAPSIQLTCASDVAGSPVITAPSAHYSEGSKELLHTINLFLEIFGAAHIYDSQLKAVKVVQPIRLNWQVLPKGEMPWEKLAEALEPVIQGTRERQRGFLKVRLETIAEYGPDFVAVGQAGFSGYVVFGFKELGLYVLESGQYGNATYILEEDWKALSQQSKAFLIHGDLYKHRIVHRQNWTDEIREILAAAIRNAAD